MEHEANRFASELLMPASLVESWCAENPTFTVTQFAKAFGVPAAVAVMRLTELEMTFDIAE